VQIELERRDVLGVCLHEELVRPRAAGRGLAIGLSLLDRQVAPGLIVLELLLPGSARTGAVGVGQALVLRSRLGQQVSVVQRTDVVAGLGARNTNNPRPTITTTASPTMIRTIQRRRLNSPSSQCHRPINWTATVVHRATARQAGALHQWRGEAKSGPA
jgi:hypothetical protein